jgi:hypothetical protein
MSGHIISIDWKELKPEMEKQLLSIKWQEIGNRLVIMGDPNRMVKVIEENK